MVSRRTPKTYNELESDVKKKAAMIRKQRDLLEECERALEWYAEFDCLHGGTRTLASDILAKLRAQEKVDEAK